MNRPDKKEFVQFIQSNQGIINSLCTLYFTSIEDQASHGGTIAVFLAIVLFVIGIKNPFGGL